MKERDSLEGLGMGG